MDVGEDDIGLIHSKFRKAQRKQVVSRLSTECPPSPLPPTTGPTTSLIDPVVVSSPAASSQPETSIIRGASCEESMHVDLATEGASYIQETPTRLESVITSLQKSPLFGTTPHYGPAGASTSGQPNTHVTSPVGGRPSVGHPHIQQSSSFPCEVFRFDSTDRERYLCSAISEEEEVFSPEPSPSLSTHSFSYDSPQITLDSPRITISPLRIQDSPPYAPSAPPLTPSPKMDSQNRLLARPHPSLAMLPPSATVEQSRCLFGVPSSPVSPLTPNTPLSPSPLFNVDQSGIFQQGFLAELYRRRCHSDSDLPLLPDCPNPKVEPTDLSMKAPIAEPTQSTSHPKLKKPIPHPLTIPCKGGSLESEQSSPQDSPLDLSLKSSRERFSSSSTSSESLTTTRFVTSLAVQQQPSPGHSAAAISIIRGDIASPTTRNSVALRYNLDVSPVVEEMPAGADMAFICPVCGQMFSLHDRLAKHMASRHKSKPHDPNKSYPCDICHRSFARSDMLTRHVRLHTGIKPYTCRTCGQVFSRSDHLSTHQRTHTGEKPYKCPQCPYSACRRDMITRHLRTHARNSSSSSSSISDTLGAVSTPTSVSEIGEERRMKIEHPRPPSSNSSLPPDSPLSSTLISSLSVKSP